jgi:hypothetical protein
MKKKIFLIILPALLACSCSISNETEKYQTRRNNIVNVRDKIVEIEIEEPLISSVNRFYLMDDYLIVLDVKSLGKQIHLFDKNDFSYITGTAYRGQGPDEIANIGLIAVDEARRTFYVNDHGKQKVFSYPLDSVLSNPSYGPQVKMEMNETLFPDYYQMIDDTTSIGKIIQPIGNNNFKPTAGKMNMNTGEITLMKYENPKITGRKRSSVAVSLAHGLYAEYYHNRDLMTLCNLDGDLICNIYGPGWSEDRSRNSYYGKVVFCGDKIYASYTGEKSFNEQRQSNLATKLLVFDIQGNYLQTLETDLQIVDICYDAANHRLLLSLDDDIQFAYLPLD